MKIDNNQFKSRHVTLVYIGPLHTRGRLLKQIDTLQNAGIKCEVILGNTDLNPPDYELFEFPIRSQFVDLSQGKVTSFVNMIRFCKIASKWVNESGADTVLCLALESLMAGVWAKNHNSSLRLIFDNNELHLESYHSKIKRMIWKIVHNYAIRKCDQIFHAESNRMKYFKSCYDSGKASHHVLENFPFYIKNAPRKIFSDECIHVIYLGGFGNGRFTKEIIEAFASMPEFIKLDIVGSGAPLYVSEIKKCLSDLKAENVCLMPSVPYRDIPNLLKRYQIGIALYRNTNLNNYYCAPNKVYDYIMNGMPVITNNYPGLIEVVEQNNIGVCVEHPNKDALKKAIEKITQQKLWRNITDDIRQRYCWEKQTSKYLKVFGHETEPSHEPAFIA